MAKQKNVMLGWLGGAAIVIVALAVFGVVQLPELGQGSTVDSESPSAPLVCDSTTTPELTVRAFDKENIGTALTEATNLYRRSGEVSWNTFTAGTAFAVSPGQELDIVMGVTTSDFTDNAYGQRFSYTVPCLENPSIEKAVANDEIETSLVAEFINADNDVSTAETFSAGETQVVSLRLKAGTDEYFGNPFVGGYPNVLVLDLNSTSMDAPLSVYLADGTELSAVPTPIRHQAGAGKKAYAYELPVIGDKYVQVFLELNADDTNAPVLDDTAYIYAGGYFINSDTGALEIGVEDQDGNAVGTDAADSVTLDFTA